MVAVAVTILCALIMGVTVLDGQGLKMAQLRQFGPYGRIPSQDSSTSRVRGNPQSNINQQYENRLGNHNIQNNPASSGISLQEFYKNHNLDSNHNVRSDVHDSYNNHANQFSTTHNQNNPFSDQQGQLQNMHLDSNSFNGFGFDVDHQIHDNERKDINAYNNRPNSEELEELIRLHQANPDKFNDRFGHIDLPAAAWDGIRRSTSGLSGLGPGSKTLDVYSIFAIGMFAAFIAYVVYYFIGGGEGGGEGRIDFNRDAQAVLGVLEGVTNAFQRWTAVEESPETFSEQNARELLKWS